MCCGNNKKRAALSPQSPQSASRSSRAISPYTEPDFTVGSEGMTLLEYQLTKAGPVVYIGAVTQQRYVFGGKHKRGLVDNRDVPGLIARIEDRRHAFGYAQVVEPPIPEPVAAATKEIVTETIKEEAVVLPPLPIESAKPRRRVKSA